LEEKTLKDYILSSKISPDQARSCFAENQLFSRARARPPYKLM
jgi:hypothetical protein